MLLAVLELPVKEVISNHRGAVPLGRVQLPLPIVVIPVTPIVLSVSVLLPKLVLALVLVLVGVGHGAVAVVPPVEELPVVGAVVLLVVFALAAELSLVPVALVVILVCVFHLAVSVLEVVLPLALVGAVVGDFGALALPEASLEGTFVAVLHFRGGLLPWLEFFLLLSEDHLLALAVLHVVNKLACVDNSLVVFHMSLAVLLTLFEFSLVLISFPSLQKADLHSLAVRCVVKDLALILSFFRLGKY